MGLNYSRPAEKQVKWYDDHMKTLPSLEGKVAVVTGTTSGTGYAAAEAFATLGAHVLLLNRKSQRSALAEKTLKTAVPSATFEVVDCDLADFESVKSAAAAITKQFESTGIDILCCNAGVMALNDQPTKDGFDIQMQVNHISHFLLTQKLWPVLEKAAALRGEARVFQHSSEARQGSSLNPEFLKKNGGNLGGNKVGFLPFTGPPWERYHQSKLANCVFTYALHDKIQAAGSKVKAVLAHPGLSSTPLQVKSVSEGTMGWSTSLLMMLSQHTKDGTLPLLEACAGKDVPSGSFFGPKSTLFGAPKLLRPERHLTDSEAKESLWKLSEEAIGEKFVISS